MKQRWSLKALPLCFSVLLVIGVPQVKNASVSISEKTSDTFVDDLKSVLSKNCTYPPKDFFLRNHLWYDEVNRHCSLGESSDKLDKQMCLIFTEACHDICTLPSPENYPKISSLLDSMKQDLSSVDTFCAALDATISLGKLGPKGSAFLKYFVSKSSGCKEFCRSSGINIRNSETVEDGININYLCVLTLKALQIMPVNLSVQVNKSEPSTVFFDNGSRSSKDFSVVTTNNSQIRKVTSDGLAGMTDEEYRNKIKIANSSTPMITLNTGSVSLSAKQNGLKIEHQMDTIHGNDSLSKSSGNEETQIINAPVGNGVSPSSTGQDSERGLTGFKPPIASLTKVEESHNVDNVNPVQIVTKNTLNESRTSKVLEDEKAVLTKSSPQPSSVERFATSSKQKYLVSGKSSALEQKPVPAFTAQSAQSNAAISETSNLDPNQLISAVVPKSGEENPEEGANGESPLVDLNPSVSRPSNPVNNESPKRNDTESVKSSDTPKEAIQGVDSPDLAKNPVKPLSPSSHTPASSKPAAIPLDSALPNPIPVDVLEPPNKNRGINDVPSDYEDTEDSENRGVGVENRDGDIDVDNNVSKGVPPFPKYPEPADNPRNSFKNSLPFDENERYRKNDDEDTGFFSYFLTFITVCGVGWILFHKKKQIIAVIVEGRRPGSARRRSSSGSGSYRKLENNFD